MSRSRACVLAAITSRPTAKRSSVSTSLAAPFNAGHFNMPARKCRRGKHIAELEIQRRTFQHARMQWQGRCARCRTGGCAVWLGCMLTLRSTWLCLRQKCPPDCMFDTRFDLVTPQGTIALFTPLVGKVNVYNVLAASAAALARGCSLTAGAPPQRPRPAPRWSRCRPRRR